MNTLVQIKSAVAELPPQDQWSLLSWLQRRLKAVPEMVQSPIYKFLPPTRISYLENQLLRFSQPRALNDPFESANFHFPELNEAFISSLDGAVENDTRDKLRSPAELKIFINELIDKFGGKFGVLSLSERWNSSLMWAHYTDRHQGCCVGFNRDHPFFADDTLQKSKLRPVTYGFSRINFAEELNGQGPGMLFYKSTDWAYEEESRVVFFWQREGPIQFTQEIKEDPLGVLIRLVQVPHEAICELIVGMETPQGLRDKVVGLGAALKVPVFEAYPSLTKLTIDREQIA
jgi:hypothetical protein